ncbi:hypothetical protein [Thalassococcus sp. BH17M4-6]|uniref:hypothetical protein n=1 Tax=Thalassococcus sp. BH17M4-6 TaxID=3413148 RepID=UPI003BF4A293
MLESRFGARRGGLARRSGKVGRDLPRAVRHDLDRVSQAEIMLAHPKLALRVDQAAVLAAAERAEAHLTDVDARDRRRGRLLGMLGALVFNLLLLGVILLLLLRWRGLV